MPTEETVINPLDLGINKTDDTRPMIEVVRDYWGKRPCNLNHSNKKVGTEDYFKEVEERKYFVEPHIPDFAQFKRWKGKKVLEVGCGLGTDAINFMRAGADYYGIDLSPESLKLAKRRFKLEDFDPDRLRCIDVEELSKYFEPESFDLVYSFGVIHHTPDPQKAIDEIYKVLKTGVLVPGELRIMLYARDSWKTRMIEMGYDQPEAQYGCPIAYTYTPEQVHELLSDFREISISQDHIFPYKVEEYKKYNYVLEDWFAAMPKEMFNKLEKKMGWHLLIKAKKVTDFKQQRYVKEKEEKRQNEIQEMKNEYIRRAYQRRSFYS